MKKELQKEPLVDDSKELVVIDYFDRIHNQWIKVEVTKEVARLIKSDNQKIRRSNNKYNRYNLSFDEVFDSTKPDNDKEEYLIDESAEINLENQQRTTIQNSLGKLPEKQRVVIEKILDENKNNREIAKELNIAEATVCERKKRAYQNIKKYISDTQN